MQALLASFWTTPFFPSFSTAQNHLCSDIPCCLIAQYLHFCCLIFFRKTLQFYSLLLINKATHVKYQLKEAFSSNSPRHTHTCIYLLSVYSLQLQILDHGLSGLFWVYMFFLKQHFIHLKILGWSFYFCFATYYCCIAHKPKYLE